MDKYLESLVRKNAVEEPAPEAEVEQGVVVEEAPVEEPVVEEVSEEADLIEEITPEAEPTPTVETIPIEETVPESEQARAVGDEVFVEAIRIFDRPGQTYPPHIFTGVVILDGAFESFTKVKYMKHGFGLVAGYTSDIK